jgi:solute carrier family 25 phosphate transporter 23/24/25/41
VPLLQVSGVVQGFKAIYAEGGVAAFWRGNGTNVLKVAPETAAKFASYEYFKRLICADVDNITVWERFGAGAGAGAFAQFAIYPLEIAKTRMALSITGQYRSISHCIGNIIRHEGPRALYKGLLASVVGIIPYSGVDLTVFSLLKDWYEERWPDSEPGVHVLLACGAMATTCGQVVSYPLQLVRTRLQAQGMKGRPVVYAGIWDCVRKTVAAEGLRGLYRGIGPNFMKSVPAMAISYSTYEMTKRALLSARGQGASHWQAASPHG